MENNLEHVRHSLAHLLAAAVMELYPDAKRTIGPAIDNGFYFDFEFSEPLTPADLLKIEKRMKKILPHWKTFERHELTAEEAKKEYPGNPYKHELIDEFTKEGQKVSFYKSGDYWDLCKGGHVENMKEIDADSFKLTKLAGAYWRGDEKNKQLTRIYGVAFATKAELDGYLTMMAEAEKRDHRKLGTALELFMFHETAPGMPYWLPKGLILYNELVNYWRIEHTKLGYQEIASPLVNKAELWKTSGHWEHYKDDMFIANMGENEVYGIKPMNCPNAMLVFGSKPHSYKELPLRLCDTDRLHRYERSGTLNGLLRCRSFQQDDSHNFISENMIGSEYEHIFKICEDFYGIFGLEYSFRLGTRPTTFLGEQATWDKAEKTLKEILEKSGKKYKIAEGDGAFYGPKIDILMKDAIGREWQMGTIQLDFQQPQRFKLEYTDSDGSKKIPVVVHRVIYGSLERFIGVLIEHYAGNFPLWLSPVQARVIAVSEKFQDYGVKVLAELKTAGIRAELADSNETLGKRIRAAQVEKIPYVLVVGEEEVTAKMVAVRHLKTGDLGKLSTAALIEKLQKEINEKAG